MPRLYPLFVDLHQRRVLIVGGGAVAERKALALIDTGALIRLVAPTVTPGLRRLAETGAIDWQHGTFADTMLRNQWLVIAATDNAALNEAVATAARARRLFANVVDDAALSTFQVPAVVDRHPLQIAISSGGTAPALATWVRAHLETILDGSLGPLAALLARWRGRIRSALPDSRSRRRFYDRVMGGTIPGLVRAGSLSGADRELRRVLESWPAHPAGGRVALVGAGPGDAGLLTLRGFRLLQQADIVLHDRLVSPEVLELARRDAEKIEVGKRSGGDSCTQQRINALMAQHAEAGRLVVRLKGGDPLVFGRGGEEMEYLRALRIDYEVVPGITAALGCAAYAGVPVTHRDHAQSVHLVTAHCRRPDGLDWRALAGKRQTLAVYMGVSELASIGHKLLSYGLNPDTPFALVENGTRPEQRVVAGRLSRLP
ncbi:MAG TPA: siroheme synthase CysG, partial [Gammaproteobacteria bacterium]|nr:siroheme synthase CysG [Gammaproteobacteria bacterium]